MATAGSSSIIPDVPLCSRNFPSPNFSSNEALLCLHRCTSFNQMKQIHGRIIRSGLHQNQLIVARLIRLCSSFGKLDYAYLVLERIEEDPSSFSWNLLIRAHTENGDSVRAVLLYNLMIRRGVHADKFTFPFAMKACLESGLVEKAREVYGFAVKTGLWRDVYLNNVLMAVYFKYGALDDALKVFDKMPQHKTAVSWTTAIAGLLHRGRVDHARKLFDKMPYRNVVSFTAMINGYAKSEKPEKAFELFAQMQQENVTPNEYTLVGLAMSCSRLGILKLGFWVHEYAISNSFEIGPFLGTALIDMYSKCGSPDHAKRVFEAMDKKSRVTWNAMITSLGVHGNGEEALSLFEEMERKNIEPDTFTLTGVLAACLQTNDIEKGIKYFYHMINRYGIEPVPEHYTYVLRMNSADYKSQ